MALGRIQFGSILNGLSCPRTSGGCFWVSCSCLLSGWLLWFSVCLLLRLLLNLFLGRFLWGSLHGCVGVRLCVCVQWYIIDLIYNFLIIRRIVYIFLAGLQHLGKLVL